MKRKLFICFCFVFSVLSLFISCKKDYESYSGYDTVREISFEEEKTELKDELIFYSLTESYKLSEEEILYDVKSFISSKQDIEMGGTVNSRGVSVNDEIKKVSSFTKKIINNSCLRRGVETEEEINFSVFNVSSFNDNEIVITSDDERLGSILCVFEDTDVIDFENDPVLNIFMNLLEDYVDEIQNELELITENDLELFKEKYDITDEQILNAKREYENSLESRKFWGYDSWSSWTVSDSNFNNYLYNVTWDQGAPYNYAIQAMEGDSYLTGCGATAVAQIMAYHKWPKKYERADLAILKQKWPLASEWDGVYNWDEITRIVEDDEILPSEYLISLGALMYEVSKGIKSQYGRFATSSTMSNRIDYFRSHGYICDNQKLYSYKAVSESLKNNCPVMIRGETKSGDGHAWVIDGSLQRVRTRNYYVFWIPFKCNETVDYVHCNYGWTGSNNEGFENDEKKAALMYNGKGYYKSGVFSTSVGDFNNSLKIVTNIRPNK